jgi:hypothetical protein
VILDFVRTTLHTAITTPAGDGFAPLRFQKGIARRLNVTFGQPLCSAEQLASRRAAEARLAKLRSDRSPGAAAPAATAKIAAPVMVYFEKDRNARELARVEDLLKAKAIPYQLLDVAEDEATMTFVKRAADCEDDDLPIVFVAGAPIGDYRALVEADVSGALAKAIYG